MGITSLVLGIVSLVSTLFTAGIGSPVGAVCGIIGIALGALARQHNPEKAGMATGGLVCSIIGTVLSLLLVVACYGCAGGCAACASAL